MYIFSTHCKIPLLKLRQHSRIHMLYTKSSMTTRVFPLHFRLTILFGWIWVKNWSKIEASQTPSHLLWSAHHNLGNWIKCFPIRSFDTIVHSPLMLTSRNYKNHLICILSFDLLHPILFVIEGLIVHSFHQHGCSAEFKIWSALLTMPKMRLGLFNCYSDLNSLGSRLRYFLGLSIVVSRPMLIQKYKWTLIYFPTRDRPHRTVNGQLQCYKPLPME